MKKIITFALVFILCFSTLCSCQLFEKAAEAQGMVYDFVSALENGDYEAATTYLHPDSTATADSLEEMILSLEEQHEIDFSNGVTFVQQTSSYTNSSTGCDGEGTVQHDIGYTVEIDGKTFTLEAVVLENSEGLGILSFVIKMSVGF